MYVSVAAVDVDVAVTTSIRVADVSVVALAAAVANVAVVTCNVVAVVVDFFNSLQCVERRLLPKAKISSTTHVQLLQWLHGKQQQHTVFVVVSAMDVFLYCSYA